METTYDMPISCFKLIFISHPRKLTKTRYSFYKISLTFVLSFIKIAYIIAIR